MRKKLFFEATLKYILGIALLSILIFIPAGTFNYFGGWLLMIILFVPMFFAGIVMMIKSPDLLKRRLDAKEKQKEQRMVIILSGIMFITGFIIAGLNIRFNWYLLPVEVSITGAVIFLLGYIMYAEVLCENVYLSRTIQVQKEQTVISTGLYSIVRHPMYSATLILFLSIPIILGSLLSLIVFLAYPFIIVLRINEEEKFLEKELKGYTEYKEKVKYRLIPFIW